MESKNCGSCRHWKSHPLLPFEDCGICSCPLPKVAISNFNLVAANDELDCPCHSPPVPDEVRESLAGYQIYGLRALGDDKIAAVLDWVVATVPGLRKDGGE